MTLSELLNNVKKTPQNECYPDSQKIFPGVNISFFDYIDLEKYTELKCYFTDAHWICTDTEVGIRAYYINDELICASCQVGRKYDEEFEFVSEESYNKLRNWVLEKIKENEESQKIPLIDFNQNIDSWIKNKD